MLCCARHCQYAGCCLSEWYVWTVSVYRILLIFIIVYYYLFVLLAKKMRLKIGRFIWRTMVVLLLSVYVIVAILNYSLVQSYIGTAVGSFFSKECGGVVKVGSMHVNPFRRMVLYNVELITPDNDTVANAEKISCTFKGFPFKDHSLILDKVQVKNTYYHLHVYEDGINLDYLIDGISRLFPSDGETTESHPFTVRVNNLHLSNVHYKQDLEEPDSYDPNAPGVHIPHMEYMGIKARFKDVKVVDGDVWCRIVSFATTEKSGFRLDDLSGDVEVSTRRIVATNMELQADSTRLLFDALLDYRKWENMIEYCDSVFMDVTFKPESYTNMLVAAYWVPQWWGINIPVRLQGDVVGPVADMDVSDFTVSMGESTELLLDGSITGLPDIFNTTVDARVHRLYTNYKDVELLLASPITNIGQLLPASLANSLSQIGNVSVTAMVDGSFDKCYATVGVASEVGNVSGNAIIEKGHGGYSYNARLTSSGVSVASLFPNEWVSHSGFEVDLKGKGFEMATLSSRLDARLFNTRLGTESVDNTSLHAVVSDRVMNADVSVSDSLLDLDMVAMCDWNDSVRKYALDLNLDNADFHLLIPDKFKDSLLLTDVRIKADASGNDWECVSGSVVADSGLLMTKNGGLGLAGAELRLDAVNGMKNVDWVSPWFDFTVRGFFDYADIPKMFTHFSHSYLPQYYTKAGRQDGDKVNTMWDDIVDASLDVALRWKNGDDLLSALSPSVSVAKGTMLTVSHNFTEPMRVVMRSDSIRLGQVALNNVGVRGGQQTSRYALSVEMRNMEFKGAPLLKNVDITLGSKPEETSLELNWGDKPGDSVEADSHGDMALLMLSDSTGNYISITKTKFYIQGSRWDLMCTDNDIVLRDAYLSVADLRLLSERQRLVANAEWSKSDSSYISLKFDRLVLNRFASLLLRESGFEVDGVVTGDVNFLDLNKVPYFDAALDVNGVEVNSKGLGDWNIHTTWESVRKELALRVDSKMYREAGVVSPVSVLGKIDMASKDPKLDLVADFSHISANIFYPILDNVFSDIDGVVRGDVMVGGSLSKPDISASVKIDQGLVGLKPTGVEYSFSDVVEVENSMLLFDDFQLKDVDGNSAAVNGVIDLFSPDGISLNLDLATDNIKVLDIQNTNNPYYGTIYASIAGRVSGEIDNLAVAARVRPNPGSRIAVPLSDKRQVRSHEFITFVSDEVSDIYVQEPVSNSPKQQFVKPKSLFSLIVDLEATPDLRLVVPVDLNQMYARVDATGNGDIQLRMSETGTPLVTGDYVISDGTLALKLPLFERNFTIESGSSIDFPGDIGNATFDITALYLQRVNLSSLTGPLSTESTRKNIQVQSVIALEGGLQTPSLKFDIRLPNADQSVEEEVFAYIDRTNERDMLNQTVSLLLFGQFYNSSTSAIEGILDNGLSSGYALVANSVGNYVSKIVDFVDVNFDYKAATTLTTEQFDIDISKEWNKFYFESTFGYGGEAQALVEPDNSILMGDMLVGYKLGPLLHLYVFNRSNNNDYTRIDLPYKQGVGLKVTRDFNTWSDLFRKKTKPVKNGLIDNID